MSDPDTIMSPSPPERRLPVSRTMTEAIATALREDILTGRLEPGARLQQAAVAERFGVSITPVREAFSLLVRWGMVVNEAHRGCSVFKPEPDDLRQSYEIRIVLEELATRKGVPNLTDADLARMRATLDEDRTLPDDASEQRFQLNDTFHGVIYGAADNPKLEEMIADLRLKTVAYLRIFNAEPIAREEGAVQHEAIYEACRRYDPDDAAEQMRAHLQHTFDVVAGALAQR